MTLINWKEVDRKNKLNRQLRRQQVNKRKQDKSEETNDIINTLKLMLEDKMNNDKYGSVKARVALRRAIKAIKNESNG